MPTPVFMTLLFVGLILLSFTKKKKAALICLWSSFVLIFLSFLPASGALAVSAIEDGYDSSILDGNQNVSYISVLGHGHIDADKLSANAALSAEAVKRLVEGLRLAHLYPEAKLILTGYKGSADISHEELMEQAALSLNFPEDRIICLSDCRDTADEASQVKSIAGDNVVALVSEASHLRRASYLYEQHAVKVITSAADCKGVVLDGGQYIFNSRSLRRTERAWYEFLGNIWVRLRS